MDIKEFIRQDDIQKLLAAENLDGIYEECHVDSRNKLTEFFLHNNINPLDYVTIIYNQMYSKLTITEIIIPNHIISIYDLAFYDCKSLISITIPNSVKYITFYAFIHCPNLTIKCEENSYAHNYALENNIKFELI